MLEILKKTLYISMAVLFVVLLTVASAGASSSASSSQKTEMKSVSPYKYNEPNQFVLNGVGHTYKDVHIVYSTTSKTGKPIFNYPQVISFQLLSVLCLVSRPFNY